MHFVELMPPWMFTLGVAAFTTVALFSPGRAQAAQWCSPLPAPSSEIEVRSVAEGETGEHAWAATASYLLSTGDEGRVDMYVDGDGNGEVSFSINGELISHTVVTHGWTGRSSGRSIDSWSPDVLHHDPEVVVELLRVDVGAALIDGMIPQEFKCSPFGRKAVKAAKHLWTAASAAAGAACSAATGAVIACAGAAAATGAIGADTAEGYCD